MITYINLDCPDQRKERKGKSTFSSFILRPSSFILLLFFFFTLQLSFGQNISINEDGTAPDGSAMLDVVATDKGVLIPRMTQAQRTGIANPATSLIVYQTDGDAGFYFNAGTPGTPSWVKLVSDDNLGEPVAIQDADGDTKIDVEGAGDEDKVRIELEGNEYYVFESGRLELTNGSQSTFIGEGAGESVNVNSGSSSNNTFIGFDAGKNNTSGGASVLIGYRAGEDSDPNSGVAIGARAGRLSSGTYNVFIGTNAGQGTTTGDDNIFLGYRAGESSKTGDNNIGFGHEALWTLDGGNNNIGIGNSSGRNTNNYTKNNNIYIGYESGLEHEGDNSILIGHQAGQNLTKSDLLYIENSNSTTPLIYGDFANDSLKVYGTLSVDSAKDGSGYAFPGADGTANQYLQTDGSGKVSWAEGDNLGNHSANQRIQLNGNKISNDGDNEGLQIFDDGQIVGNPATLGAGNVAFLANGDFQTSGQGTGYYFTGNQIGITGNNGNSGDMRFKTGTNDRMQITSTGQVKINTTSPSSYRLDVNGSFSANSVNVNDNYTLPNVDGNPLDVLQTDGSGTVSWAAPSPDTLNLVEDADGDTRVEVEQTTDEDKVRIFLGGSNAFLFEEDGIKMPSIADNNLFVGNSSGSGNSGAANLSLGHSALAGGISGNWNTAIGHDALSTFTSGNENVAIGPYTGWNIGGGSQNVFLGYEAGGQASTAGNQSGVIKIGHQAGFGDATDNKLYIENSNSSTPLIFGDFAEDSLVFNGVLTLDSAKDGSGYTFPGADGNPLEVLQTDGNGNVSWAAASGGGGSDPIWERVTRVFNDLIRDSSDNYGSDFVIGSPTLNDEGSGSYDKRMFFDKGKGAFRAGRAQSTEWDNSNIGNYSSAFGDNNESSGANSTAFGEGNVVSGSHSLVSGNDNVVGGKYSIVAGRDNNIEDDVWGSVALGISNSVTTSTSTAIGFGNTSSGRTSTTLGIGNTASSYVEFVVGSYSTVSSAIDSNSFNSNDRLFVIGNGSGSGVRSNALVMLKNGNTTLNGLLTLSDGSNPFTLPNSDGNPNEVLQTDGNGIVSWAAASGGGGVFEKLGNTIRDTTSNFNSDFVIGSPTLDYSTEAERMFFDKSKAAFRAGFAAGDAWDSDSLGNYSAAFGHNTTASGSYSFAAGRQADARGSQSIALGYVTVAQNDYDVALGFAATAEGERSLAAGDNASAEGFRSAALGYFATAEGEASVSIGTFSEAQAENSIALGYESEAQSYAEIALGSFPTTYTPNSTTAWDADDRLLSVGNGTGSGARSDALTILKDGKVGIGTATPTENLEVNGRLKTNGIQELSDARYKTNVETLTSALEKLTQLRGVSYDWDTTHFPEKNFNARKQIGLIAQELEPIFPELVHTDQAGYKSVDYSKLVAVLVEAVKEQNRRLSGVEGKVSDLEAKLDQANDENQAQSQKIKEIESRLSGVEAQNQRLNQLERWMESMNPTKQAKVDD